jgi:hypothetical protein
MTKAEYQAQKEKESENEVDFEKDISINKYKLDEECLSHSSLYFRYSSMQADAKTRVSKAKDNLELVEAERNLAIRKSFADSGVKVTEAMITSALIQDKKVIEAKNQVREAEDTFMKLSVAVQAFEHRKSELDNLVKLYCSGYYSVPNSSSEVKKTINEQTANAVRKNLNK